MKKTYADWSISAENGETIFWIGDKELTRWNGLPQLSMEHIALIAHLYECGVHAGSNATKSDLRIWATRADEIAADAAGLADDIRELLG